MEENKEIASQAGHWYGQDGSCQYTYTDSKGAVKPTTLRRARKLGLLPSVTTILQMYPKPFLDAWKQKQVLMSALTLSRNPEETDESYIQRIMADSKEQARKAAERGTAIHGMIERYLTGQELDTEGIKLGTRVINAVMQHLNTEYELSVDEFFMACESERSFASKYGYAGKVDLHSKELNFVLDFKTKEGELPDQMYDDHHLQLSAYAHGLGMPDAKRIICFISTTTDDVRCVTDESKTDEFETFLACLNLWQKVKKYVPVINGAEYRFVA